MSRGDKRGVRGTDEGPGMPLCATYTHIYATHNDTRPPSTGGRHRHRGTQAHTQKPASGDNGGRKDTTGGRADERRRRRRDDQVLEQLSATDTLKDNPRVVSPHMCAESTPNYTW